MVKLIENFVKLFFLDAAYSYCIHLKESEKLEIDKQVRKNRFELKFAIFFPVLSLPTVQQVPFFPVEGFSPQQIVRTVKDSAESTVEEKLNHNPPVPQEPGIQVLVNSEKNSVSQESRGIEKIVGIVGGDQAKTGPGARAKADALRTASAKKSSSSFFASGFTSSAQFCNYHHDRASCQTRTLFQSPSDKTGPNSDGPSDPRPSIVPGKPVKRPGSGSQKQSQKNAPLELKNKKSDSTVKIRQKNIRKWITEEDKVSNCRKFNEQLFKGKLKQTIENPSEVLEAVDIHRKGLRREIYIKEVTSDSGEVIDRFAVVRDKRTAVADISSRLSNEEYTHLKETGTLDLFDLCRDPQTRVLNLKSREEADSIARAQEEQLPWFEDIVPGSIRRPYNVSESKQDFMGKTVDGKWVPFDLKAVVENDKRSIVAQIIDITRNVNQLAEESTDCRIIVDVSKSPAGSPVVVYRQISDGLNEAALGSTSFVFNR
jgi:hypothetical protein